MAHKRDLGQSVRGEYRRTLGRKPDGQIQKFYFGYDKLQALRRNALLEALWDECEKPYWTDEYLLAAKAIARGKNLERPKGPIEAYHPSLVLERRTGHMLHHYMEEYRIHGIAKSMQNNVKRLIEHCDDIDLTYLDIHKCDEMLKHWADRPDKKHTKTPIAQDTASNHITTLKMFFKWLARQGVWTIPPALMDNNIRIREVNADYIKTQTRIPVFTLEDLRLIYKHANPNIRLALMLSLNCAFKESEVTNLLWSECHIGITHPHYKFMGDFIFRTRRKTRVYGEWLLWKNTKELIRRNNSPYVLINNQQEQYNRFSNCWRKCIKSLPMQFLSFSSVVDTGVQIMRDIAGGEIADTYKCHGRTISNSNMLDRYSNRCFDKVFIALKEFEKKLDITHI